MTLFVKVSMTCKKLKECLVGMILGKMEKHEWKIGGRGVWLGGEKGEKSGGPGYFLSGPTKT